MTKARATVSASLAARGIAERWANEEESAALSGMTADRFYAEVAGLEKDGFPKKSSRNGLRFIPHIDRFWNREAEQEGSAKAGPVDDGLTQENWDGYENSGRAPGKRVAA